MSNSSDNNESLLPRAALGVYPQRSAVFVIISGLPLARGWSATLPLSDYGRVARDPDGAHVRDGEYVSSWIGSEWPIRPEQTGARD
jgi:hypothetical protein